MRKTKIQTAEDYLRGLKKDCEEIRYCLQNGRSHRVTLTRWWTGDKPRVQFFRSAELAADFVKTERANKKADETLKLGVNELAQARNAFTKLEGTGKTLEDVVNDYIARYGKKTQKRFSEVVPLVLDSIAGNSDLYIEGQKCQLGVIQRETGNKLLSEYTPELIAKYLVACMEKPKEWGYYSVKGYYASFNLIMKYAVRHNILATNPVAEGALDCIRQLKRPDEPIPFYSVEDSGRLLRAALQNPCLGLEAVVPLALFAGIRHEELTKLSWDDVHLRDNYIQIRKTIAKNKQSRRIPLAPDSPLCVLKAWLERVEQKAGPVFDKSNEKKRFSMLFDAADVQKKRNGFRHTFASMFIGAYGLPDLARTILGQTSPKVLFANYAEDITPSEALPFWKLFPPPLTPAEELDRQILTFEPENKPAGRKYVIVPLETKQDEARRQALTTPDTGEDEDFTVS